MSPVLVRRLFLSVVLLAAAQVYAQTQAPTFPNPGKTSMSRDQQHALGMQAAAQVFQHCTAGRCVAGAAADHSDRTRRK